MGKSRRRCLSLMMQMMRIWSARPKVRRFWLHFVNHTGASLPRFQYFGSDLAWKRPTRHAPCTWRDELRSRLDIKWAPPSLHWLQFHAQSWCACRHDTARAEAITLLRRLAFILAHAMTKLSSAWRRLASNAVVTPVGIITMLGFFNIIWLANQYRNAEMKAGSLCLSRCLLSPQMLDFPLRLTCEKVLQKNLRRKIADF